MFRSILVPITWIALGLGLVVIGLLTAASSSADEKEEAAPPPKRVVKPSAKPKTVRIVPKVEVTTEDAAATPDVVPSPVDEKKLTPDVAKTKRPEDISTHEQISKISLGGGDAPCTLNTFCLSPDGKLIAAVDCAKAQGFGTKSKATKPSGQLRWFDAGGKALDVWTLDIGPTAVNVSPDGTIFVAGSGRLLKLDKRGKVLLSADVPNKKELEDNADAIKAELAEIFVSPKGRMERSLKSMRERIVELEAKEKAAQDDNKELSRSDRVRLASARRTVTSLEKSLADQPDKGISQNQEEQIKSFAEKKKRVSGIAVTDKDVFVACSAALGFGYDVWRLDHNLKDPVKIVQKLRGCCGQMDIQALGTDLCVAENSMHRVCRFDRDGKQLKAWGEREGISQVGFEGCCNPMNLRIAANGEIYTSESSIGRIRRFSPDGEYLGLVGKAKLISGCKHVAIGVTADTKRVYLLDVTNSEILVMEQKAGDRTAAK